MYKWQSAVAGAVFRRVLFSAVSVAVVSDTWCSLPVRFKCNTSYSPIVTLSHAEIVMPWLLAVTEEMNLL